MRFGALLDGARESATPLLTMPFGLARSLVSGSKIRFIGEGFDLDLTYITDRIIAMGLPAESLEAAWRNSLGEVARFLHARHPAKHRVYNLCDERDYDAERWFHAALHLPFPDHHPPAMDTLLVFVADARAWLAADEQNVVAVHCKAGKGRTGVMIVALLIALDHPACTNAHDAIAFFRAKRTRDGDACRNGGQIRYIEYYERLHRHEAVAPRALQLVRIELRRTGDEARRPNAAAALLGAFGTFGGGGGGGGGGGAADGLLAGSFDMLHMGGESANPLTVTGGSSLLIKIESNGHPPVSLDTPWHTRARDAQPVATADQGGDRGGSHSLAAVGGWFADPSLVIEASLGGLDARADVRVQLVSVGALGVVHERLWRLNFHTAFEALRGGAAAGAPAAAGGGLADGELGAEAALEAAREGGAERYFAFESSTLDDCRGFANLYEFELRLYVKVVKDESSSSADAQVL